MRDDIPMEALRIEKRVSTKMDTLMRMQSADDIAQTRKRKKKFGAAYSPLNTRSIGDKKGNSDHAWKKGSKN